MHFFKKKTIGNKYPFLRKLYFFAREIFDACLVKISPTYASKYFYKRATGKKLNLENPRNLNERLMWLKLYYKDPLIVKCSDKYEVRDYVLRAGCGNILNDLYGVFSSVCEIDWDTLPEQFVLKTTNGCGTNIFCSDKSELNKKNVYHKLSKWLKKNLSLERAEMHFSCIKPRIICEKYLASYDGVLPKDYKVFCFNGIPKLIMVIADRNSSVKYKFYDLEWKEIDILSKFYRNDMFIKKPECLNEMLKYAETLSKPFPFVRVDFYVINGSPVFGEMTFTPAACTITYINDVGLERLGEILKLPILK